MDDPEPSVSSTARAARLFGEFLRQHAGPDAVEFEEFCAQHSDEAQELRRFAERWSSAESSLGGSTSIAPTSSDSEAAGRRVVASGSSGMFERLLAKGPADRRYEPEGEIARGGMGVIQRAWDRELRRSIAMKVILEGESGSGTADATWDRRLARFLEEAQITGQLEHPGIVPVHELGLDAQGRAFFTMQRVRGRDLKEIFELVHDEREGWSLTRALGVILKVCEAMAFTHEKGVIHRDLKPANVMVGRFGETYVMDWGLAKVLDSEDSRDIRPLVEDEERSPDAPSIVQTDRREITDSDGSPVVTLDGDILGTPCYMSPEQAKGRLEDIGPAADVYSIGCMLYHLLTRQMPYVPAGQKAAPMQVLRALVEGPPTPIAQLARDVPAELIAICEKAMARSAPQRYQSMLDMAEDLRAFLENRVVSAYRTGAVQEFRKWIGRNRAMATTAAAALVLTIAGLGFAAWTQLRANRDLAQANTEIARARDDAVANEQRAERLSYAANLAASQASLSFHRADDARRRLDACAEELRGWEWHRSQKLADASLSTLEIDAGELWDVAFQPGGERFAVACGDGVIREFELETLAQTREFVGHEKAVNTVAYSPDGARLASGSGDRTVRIWDADSRATTWVLSGHKGPVVSVAWSPDSAHLVSSAWDKYPIVWEADSGEQVAALKGHRGSVNSCRYSDDGALLVTASADRTVRTWATETYDEVQVFSGSDIGIARADSSPAGVWIAAAPKRSQTLMGGVLEDQRANAVRLWRSGAGTRPTLLIGHTLGVSDVGFSPDGDRLASASADRSIRVWNLLSGRSTALLGHGAEVTSLAWSPSGELLITSSRDGTVRVWAADGIATDSFHGHSQSIAGVAVSNDDRTIYSASNDSTLRIWSIESGLVEVIRSPLGAQLHTLALHPGGEWLATSTAGLLGRWNIDERTTQTVEAHKGRIRAVAFDPQGEWLVTGGDDGALRLWSATLEPLGELEGHEGGVQSVAVAPDGGWIASGGLDRAVRISDVTTRASRRVLECEGRISDIAISPDGARLAAAQTGRTIGVWDTTTWDNIAECESPDAHVQCLTFAGDGKRLVGGLEGGSIAFWETQSWALLVALRQGSSAIRAIAFSPSGRELIFGDGAGELTHWSTSDAHERFHRRQAALAIRRSALPIVDGLFEQFGSPDTVRAMLERDDRLQGPLREAAEMLAGMVGGQPDQIFRPVRSILIDAARGEDAYSRGLWNARWSLEQEPDSEKSLLLLGMANYRLGRFPEALQALERSYSRRRSSRGRPEVVGFLAMTHARLGDTEAAAARRAELRELMQVPIFFSNQEYVDLFREVEALLGPTSADD